MEAEGTWKDSASSTKTTYKFYQAEFNQRIGSPAHVFRNSNGLGEKYFDNEAVIIQETTIISLRWMRKGKLHIYLPIG